MVGHLQLQGFDVGRDMHRLDGPQIIQSVFGAPGAKAAGGPGIGPAGAGPISMILSALAI